MVISCIFRGFLSILFPQKAYLEVFLFFPFCFFGFCLPFQNSIFLFAFCPSTPFTEDSLWGFFSFSFACLFLRFACLFDTNFPNIPFLKSNLLSFLAVYFFFFCCSCFCFHCVCFSLSVFCFCFMLAFFLVFFCFVLCFCLCLLVQG